jgi:hypothetical protein
MGSLTMYVSVTDDYVLSLRHYQLPGPPQASPEDCVKTLLRAVSSSGIYINLNYTLLDKSAHRASFRGEWGKEVEASGFQKPRFEGFAQVEGRHAWLVLAMFLNPPVKPSAVQQVRSILGSARLDGPPCPE